MRCTLHRRDQGSCQQQHKPGTSGAGQATRSCAPASAHIRATLAEGAIVSTGTLATGVFASGHAALVHFDAAGLRATGLVVGEALWRRESRSAVSTCHANSKQPPEQAIIEALHLLPVLPVHVVRELQCLQWSGHSGQAPFSLK